MNKEEYYTKVSKEVSYLEPLVLKWSNDRQMFTESSEFAQWARGQEEVGEIFKAYNRSNTEQMLDAIGDTLVTYINVMKFKEAQINWNTDETIIDLNQETCLRLAISQYESPNYPMYLQRLAEFYNSNICECLNIAYNVIKDRKGKFINKSYVKESDLIKMGIPLD